MQRLGARSKTIFIPNQKIKIVNNVYANGKHLKLAFLFIGIIIKIDQNNL